MKSKEGLIKDDLRKIFSSYKSRIVGSTSTNDTISIYEDIVKEIALSRYAFIILVNHRDSFFIPSLNKSISIESEIDGGILFECYDTKHYHHITNARRSFLYRSNVDNFLDVKLKDVVVIPIKEREDNSVIGIIWLASEIGSDNSFTQKDIEYITVIADLVSKKILVKDDKSSNIVNILLVDDSPIILRFIEIILTNNYNINILTALNAEDGIEIFRQNSIDIIFIDERMDGIKGHQAIKSIRDIEIENSMDSIPIFGITSDTTKEVKEKLLNAGASLVLHKPIDAQKIVKAIKEFRILERREV